MGSKLSMSAANSKGIAWKQVVSISLVCGLVITGCNRADKDDDTESNETTVEQPVTTETAVIPAVNCDNPMVQDRLKAVLKNTLNQQSQTLLSSYANEAEISLNTAMVTGKVNGILIDVQNAAVLQSSNDNGMTTCQASISMTLPSEDLYRASQIQAGNNQPSIQTRLAQSNIRINNNMLVDDAFTYVVGMQGGQVRARIAGQPALLSIVSEVMAGSVLKSAIDGERGQAGVTRQRETNQSNSDSQTTRQPRAVTPVEPIRPIAPPAIERSGSNDGQDSNQTAATSSANSTPGTPKVVPKDESIDMVIIEDSSATY